MKSPSIGGDCKNVAVAERRMKPQKHQIANVESRKQDQRDRQNHHNKFNGQFCCQNVGEKD